MAHTVSLIKRQQISANTALNSVFGESGYLAEEAEMGLIRLIPSLVPRAKVGDSTGAGSRPAYAGATGV